MDYRSVIESKYNRQSWQALLHDIFKTSANFRANPVPVNASSPLAVSSYQLGAITLADDSKIAVYEIKLADSVDIVVNRVGIRNLLINDWKVKGCAGAFMFCYRDNESVLRFSYVSSSFKFAQDGKIEKDETDTKRFTYLLGEGHRSKTAIKQFEELKNSKLTLKDITKAFSIEALSDRFFNEYKAIYEDIIEYVTGKRMVKVANKWEEVVIHTPNAAIMNEFCWSDNPEKAVRDYVKKLMGRIVFLQFIQKKGWLGVPDDGNWGEGDKEYLQHLYDNSSNKDNFIDRVLEILFNDINTKRENDTATQILGQNIKVPYLNGGLFEQDRSDRAGFTLPRKYMDSMLKFFSSYNFTIDENDPDDAEIGVDPEMLGRIFENLLEDNKNKGAFYTPKEIVQYMCRESLIAYLQTDLDEAEKEPIRTFVTTHKADILPDDLKTILDEKLKNVKICDPAIGSGAFPMGLLKELFECRSAIEGLSDDNAAEIKKHIIQNNIYGVDIEKGAVDIARLRFWLSIIVDEKTPHALPNMDFKIVQGNSLIPTFSGKYVNLDDNLRHVNSNKIRAAKKELSRLQGIYYSAEGIEKQQLLVDIKYQILEIVKLQMDYEFKEEVERSAQTIDIFNQTSKQVVVDEEKRKIVGQCTVLQNQLKNESRPLTERAETGIPFFDWKIMFSDIFNNQGFDIVIGNPPYVLLQTFNDLSIVELYKSLYSVASYKVDLYHLFIERGYKILKRDGVLSYINPTNYLTNNYVQSLRDLLLLNTDILAIVNIGDNVFNANVNTCIEIVKKGNTGIYLNYYDAKYNGSELLLDLVSSVLQEKYLSFEKHMIQPIHSDTAFLICTKIEACSKHLKDYASVNFGMQLRNRTIYTTDVLVNPPLGTLTKYHRKCLTGKDISEYVSVWNQRYCYFNEEARCGGCWTREVHNAKNKILVRQVGAVPICGIDTEGYAVLNSAFMIVCNEIEPFGLLGLMNSKLIKFYWQQKFEDKRKTFPKIKGTYLELLPIVTPTPEIADIAMLIWKKKLQSELDTQDLEQDLDRLVFELYGLSNQEIDIINHSVQ